MDICSYFGAFEGHIVQWFVFVLFIVLIAFKTILFNLCAFIMIFTVMRSPLKVSFVFLFFLIFSYIFDINFLFF